jgi:hypothetical protein
LDFLVFFRVFFGSLKPAIFVQPFVLVPSSRRAGQYLCCNCKLTLEVLNCIYIVIKLHRKGLNEVAQAGRTPELCA